MNLSMLDKISYIILKVGKFFLKFAIYILIVFLIGVRFFNFGIRLFYERAVDSDENAKSVEFLVSENDDIDDIAKNLYRDGIIDDTLVFKFRAYIYKTNIRPNVYELKSSMTIKNILDIFDDNEATVIYTTQNTESENEVYELSPEEE